MLEGKPQYIEMSGNLVPITKSDDEQLSIKFRPFAENRLPFAVVVPDSHQDANGHMTFLREPRTSQTNTAQSNPICSLSVSLPDYLHDASAVSLKIDSKEMWSELIPFVSSVLTSAVFVIVF